MTFNPFVILCHTLIFSVVFCVCSSIVESASDLSVPLSRPHPNPNSTLNFETSRTIQQGFDKPDDIFIISARDLPHKVVSHSKPLPSHSRKPKQQQYHPETRGLHLKSSLRNVSGIGGYKIYSLPILANELANLLGDIQSDVKKYDADSGTPFYQFATKKWYFSVIAANASLPYVYIEAVVSRFIKLSSTLSPDDITSTRVGVVLNGTVPIADVTIIPCANGTNHSYIPFSSFGVYGNLTSDKPIEINTITPFGSSCSYQLVNESAALAPFSDPFNHGAILQPRSMETEVLSHVAQTAFAMSMRLWRNPEGLPTSVKVWAATAVVLVAILRMRLRSMEKQFIADMAAEPSLDDVAEDLVKLDTGFFDLGRLSGRLVMVFTRRKHREKLSIMAVDTWMRLVANLLSPLLEMDPQTYIWAMEGKIYGPEDGNDDVGKNTTQVPIGRWELSFWEAEAW